MRETQIIISLTTRATELNLPMKLARKWKRRAITLTEAQTEIQTITRVQEIKKESEIGVAEI